MGIEKQSSRNGNYVGGFLQLFDWNAKSQKKLFSSKTDLPEKSKQKKRFDGNLPTTRLQMPDEDDILAGSSIKGSSDYSSASSVTDDDLSGTRGPSVVARLMGLDSMPPETYTTPLSECQSLPGSYYRNKNLDYHQDPQIVHSSTTLHEARYRKGIVQRHIEKFQTETLLPKLAKSVPIVHKNTFSPIKSENFISPEDAARLMEAAVKIIEPATQSSTNTKKLPLSGGASLVHLKAQKPSKVSGDSQRRGESNAVKHLKGQSMNKSWNGSADAPSERNFQDSEKNKGKSISLALQAKANVQKREGLKMNSSRTLVSQKETSEAEVVKSMLKKPTTQKALNVLNPNNQKQNCIVDRGQSPLKSKVQSAKAVSTSKVSGMSRVSSQKMVSETKNDKKQVLSSSSERVARKKWATDGSYHQSEKNEKAHSVHKGRSGKVIRSSDVKHAKCRPDQAGGKMGSDVISFTFNAPMTRLGHNVKGGDTLSVCLEQKLKELNHKMSTSYTDNLEGQPGSSLYSSKYPKTCLSISEDKKLLDGRLPSPVSVLEHSSFTESCYSSSDTADSRSTGGANQCLLGQFHHMHAELSDSASSTSAVTVAKTRATALTTTSPYHGKQRSWQLAYAKEMLCNIELMFKDYALGRSCQIIDPRLFDQLESRKGLFINGCGRIPRMNRQLMFDCVSECVDARCRQYVLGGRRSLAKGLRVVRRKERLAEDVYREISSWSSMGDFMVDELVDNDMSGKHGSWLDYEIEAFELGKKIESRILNSLIDELVSDILII